MFWVWSWKDGALFPVDIQELRVMVALPSSDHRKKKVWEAYSWEVLQPSLEVTCLT